MKQSPNEAETSVEDPCLNNQSRRKVPRRHHPLQEDHNKQLKKSIDLN